MAWNGERRAGSTPTKNDVWTQDNISYLLNWLRHAKSDYGLTMDYLGGWNERGYNKPWYENFRAALNAMALRGSSWSPTTAFNGRSELRRGHDPAFNSALDIIGMHYPDYSPQARQ